MIKCIVSACGVVARNAEEKSSHEGNKFISFPLILHLQGKDLTVKELYVTVAAPDDQTTAQEFTTGRKVKLNGVMHVRKHNDVVYYNLRTDEPVEFCESTEKDVLTGKMEFKGKINRNGVKELKSKTGKDFQAFSAFSSDSDGDKREFTWVNFFALTPIHNDYFAANKYVEVHGDLILDVFKNELSLSCRVSSVSPWELSNSNTTPDKKVTI